MKSQNIERYYIVITPFFPSPHSFRGSYVYDQVRAIMRNSNYTVIVFVPRHKNDCCESYEYEGIRVILFPVKNMPSYFFNGIFNSHNARLFLKVFRKQNIDGNNIAYAHCHTSTFGAYGMALKKHFPQLKVLLQHHCRDPYTILNGKFSSWYPNLYFRAITNIRLFKQIDIHISISKIVDDNLRMFPHASLKENYKPYNRKINRLKHLSTDIRHSIILYNGVDKNMFYPYLNKKENDGNFVIGCIGNFLPLKDQITLIKAIEILVLQMNVLNIRAVFIGSGPELLKCKDYVYTHGLSSYIEFRTEVEHSQLCAFYNTLDLFILPSVYEGFGCVFTEAYACGVPFMICEGQGATEYIPKSEYEKWVFNKHDYSQLACKIRSFMIQHYRQELQYPYDINILIQNFLNQIENYKS